MVLKKSLRKSSSFINAKSPESKLNTRHPQFKTMNKISASTKEITLEKHVTRPLTALAKNGTDNLNIAVSTNATNAKLKTHRLVASKYDLSNQTTAATGFKIPKSKEACDMSDEQAAI